MKEDRVKSVSDRYYAIKNMNSTNYDTKKAIKVWKEGEERKNANNALYDVKICVREKEIGHVEKIRNKMMGKGKEWGRIIECLKRTTSFGSKQRVFRNTIIYHTEIISSKIAPTISDPG